MPPFSEFANVSFRVCESTEEQPPFIGTRENGPATNKILDDKTDFLMLLYKGTTLEETEQLVKMLNKFVRTISIQRR